MYAVLAFSFMLMSNQKIESQKTETKENFNRKSVGVTIQGKVTTTVLTVFTVFVALIIGLPIYLYIPLGAFVFFCMALGFYLFSFRRTNKHLRAEVEALTATSENYQNPPPPPKF